jgi:hypothetical protein
MDPGTLVAVNMVLALLDKAAQIGGMIAQAQAEKRDLTVAELDLLQQLDDQARDKLNKAIADAKAAGR